MRRLLILGLFGAALWMAAGYGHVAVSAVHHLSEDVHQIRCDDTAMAELGSGATPDASASCSGGVPAAASPVAGGGANVAPPPAS